VLRWWNAQNRGIRSQAGYSEERSWEYIRTTFSPAIPRTRTLSLWTLRFLILPTENPTRRESALMRGSVTPNPADPTATATDNASQQNTSAHISQLSETPAQRSPRFLRQGLQRHQIWQRGPFHYLWFRRSVRRKFEGGLRVPYCGGGWLTRYYRFWMLFTSPDAPSGPRRRIRRYCKHLPHSYPSPFLPTRRLHLFKKTGKRNEIFFATKFGLADREPGRFLGLEGQPGVHPCGPQQVPVEVGS
jgi:hypothetical protein